MGEMTLWEEFWDTLLRGVIRDPEGVPYKPGTITPLQLLMEYHIWLDRAGHIK